MVKTAIQRLEYLCDYIPPLLSALTESEFSAMPQGMTWSRKQILGHLIDSASNNHQRFVRVQFEDVPLISYDQNKWNAHGYYHLLNGAELIPFWTSYNKHLAALAKNIPENFLQRQCKMGDQSLVTLGFLITDYVEHLEHHLGQIVSYK